MCPVCQMALARVDRGFACADGHNFDTAREGYVNLVLAQHRRSAEAGDPKDSLRHRRAFLNAGHYAPLAQALIDLLAAEAPQSILDVGCGEGYYLRQLAACAELADVHLYGTDVAKEAIRLAAKVMPLNNHGVEYAVGNTHRLPVRPGCLGAVLQVFAPGASAEIGRVLHETGLYIEVKPGPRHLAAFRALVYDEPQVYAEAEIPAGFHQQAQERISFPLLLPQADDVAGLVEMTPYKWHMNPETYGRVRELQGLQDTADFSVRLYRPTGGSR
ncbi:MAG: methyltransferase domain-containing protein [bacterium]|nr:methyltransferase domain-containing protein [bacterium]